MEAEKSKKLQLASWRPGRASESFHPDWENQESQWYKFQSEGRRRSMFQLKWPGKKKGKFSLPPSFPSLQALNVEWHAPILDKAIHFAQSVDLNKISSRKTLTDTPRNSLNLYLGIL